MPAAPLDGDSRVESISLAAAARVAAHRQPEVENRDVAVGPDHHVRALEIAVDHAAVVRVRRRPTTIWRAKSRAVVTDIERRPRITFESGMPLTCSITRNGSSPR